MSKQSNTYLIRTSGKTNGDIKKGYFFKRYKKESEQPLDARVYNVFLKDLLQSYSEAIVEEGLELKLGKLGRIRIRSKQLHFFKKDGTKAKSLRPDWKKCWELWEKKYPGLSRDEITELTKKPIVYHDNSHTQGEFYEHFWDKTTAVTKYQKFYNFNASRQYSRMIKGIVSKPNRTVFYYE